MKMPCLVLLMMIVVSSSIIAAIQFDVPEKVQGYLSDISDRST
jgi:hypothetical protein